MEQRFSQVGTYVDVSAIDRILVLRSLLNYWRHCIVCRSSLHSSLRSLLQYESRRSIASPLEVLLESSSTGWEEMDTHCITPRPPQEMETLLEELRASGCTVHDNVTLCWSCTKGRQFATRAATVVAEEVCLMRATAAVHIPFSSFREWRARVKLERGFDRPQQLAYDVFRLISSLRQLGQGNAIQRHLFWGLVPGDAKLKDILDQAAYTTEADSSVHSSLRDSVQASEKAADTLVHWFPEALEELNAAIPACPAADLTSSVVARLQRLYWILQCNSHHHGPGGLDLSCFPAIAVGLNHSCDPNCVVFLDELGLLSLIAARPLAAEELLCQSYVPLQLRDETGLCPSFGSFSDKIYLNHRWGRWWWWWWWWWLKL